MSVKQNETFTSTNGPRLVNMTTAQQGSSVTNLIPGSTPTGVGDSFTSNDAFDPTSVAPVRSSTAVPPVISTTTRKLIPTESTTREMTTAAVLPPGTVDDGDGGGVNVGLAIGLPFFFLALILVFIFLFFWRRRRRSHKTFSPEEPNHNDTTHKSKPEIYIRTPSREGSQLYTVRHAFNAHNESHLSLTIGQFVQVLGQERDGWMRGTIDDEKEGWFPASCVKKLAGLDQPAFVGEASKLELDEGKPLDDVDQSTSAKGVVNAAFQVNDENGDRERTTRNQNGNNPATDVVIVDCPTNPVAVPRKRRQGSLLSGSGSYREVIPAAEDKESDPGTRQSAEYMLRSPSTDVETRNEEISPVIAHNVSKSAIDTSSETDLARGSSEVLTATHAGWTSGEMTNSHQTIPALYIQDMSEDVVPPSPDSGFASPRKNEKPYDDDQGEIFDHSNSGEKEVVPPDVAVYHVTRADDEDTESSDVDAKVKPDVPTRFVTPRVMKIGRNTSNCKDIEEQLNHSMLVTPQLGLDSVKHEPKDRELVHVTPLSGNDYVKDGETTPETEHEANFGDVEDDKNDAADSNETFVDDFMKRTAPALETPVPDDAPSEPEDVSAERPQLPSKPARLKFWNKRPKSLSKLLRVNLPGSRRKNQEATDAESSATPEGNATSPSKTASSGDLPSPTKPPRPSSPPVRDPRSAPGISMVGDVIQDVPDSPTVEDSPAANPATDLTEIDSRLGSNAADPHATSMSKLKADDDASPDSLRSESLVLASPLLSSNGGAEPHNDGHDVDDGRVIATVRDDGDAVRTKISIELGVNTEEANVTSVESGDDPTLHPQSGVSQETSSGVDSDITSHEQEGDNLQGAVVQIPEEPVQSYDTRTDGENDEEPSVSQEKVSPVSTEEEDISIGDNSSPDNLNYRTPLESTASPVHDNPDMSPKSPLRFFTPAGFTTGSPLKNKRLDYGDVPEIEMSPKMEMNPDGKQRKDDVSALRFVTPAGFVPGSPEKEFAVAPLEAEKIDDIETEQEDIATGGREKEVSPHRVIVAKLTSPKEETASVIETVTSGDIVNDDDRETVDKPGDTNTMQVSPLRFVTPPLFATQQGHYGTVQLPDTLGGGKHEVESTPPGADTILKDSKDDRSTPSAEDNQDVLKQTYDTSDVVLTNNDSDEGHTNTPDMSNDHSEIGKAVVVDDSKDIDTETDTSVSDDVATRLRFFTPAQFIPLQSHHDRISPLSSPTDPAGRTSLAVSPKDAHDNINLASSRPNISHEPSDEHCTEANESITEPTCDTSPDTSHDVHSETTSPSPLNSTPSIPDEHHNGLNGNVTADDGINENTPSSPPLSPRLFTATKYSSPKSYHPFHTVSPSPLASILGGDEAALTHDTRDDVPPSLPQDSPPPLPACPPPLED